MRSNDMLVPKTKINTMSGIRRRHQVHFVESLKKTSVLALVSVLKRAFTHENKSLDSRRLEDHFTVI